MNLGLHQYFRTEPAKEGLPELLLFHGTGGNERDLEPLAHRILPGAGLLGIRGNVLEHGLPRFFQRLSEGVFDLDDLSKRTDDLHSFLQDAFNHYSINPKLSVAIGYSNGANIISSLLLKYPGIIGGAILLRGMVPFKPEKVPDLAGTNILMLNGMFDPIVPSSEVEGLTGIFKAAGATLKNDVLRAGHQLTDEDLIAMQDWLAGLTV